MENIKILSITATSNLPNAHYLFRPAINIDMQFRLVDMRDKYVDKQLIYVDMRLKQIEKQTIYVFVDIQLVNIYQFVSTLLCCMSTKINSMLTYSSSV